MTRPNRALPKQLVIFSPSLARALGIAMVAIVWASGTRAWAIQLTAQQKQEVHVHYERATRAYDLGKYSEAVDEYQKVYEIDGDPVMLFNIAQAYRLNDQAQDAVHFYRRYLQRSPEARNKDDVERKIASLEKLIEERRKAAAAVAPPPPKTGTAPAPLPTVEEQPAISPPPVVQTPLLVAPPPAAPPTPPSGARRAVGWSLVGVGVVAGAVAVVEGLSAKSYGDKVTNASQSGGTYDPSWQSSGKTANVVAIVCGAGGAALALVGAIVLITNGSSSSASDSGTPPAAPSTVSLAPWLGPGIAGGELGLRF